MRSHELILKFFAHILYYYGAGRAGGGAASYWYAVTKLISVKSSSMELTL